MLRAGIMRGGRPLKPGFPGGRPALSALLALFVASAPPHAFELAGQDTAPRAGSAEEEERPLRALRPGDAIHVSSWMDENMEGEYIVDEDGKVVLPVLGTRSVTNVPAAELRRELMDEYRARFRQETIQVRLLRRIRILGEVREPGLYRVDPTMTLGDILAEAGGITERGAANRIRLVRDGETVIEARLRPDAAITDELHSGDQIMVLQRSWLARHSTIFIGSVVSGLVFLLTRR